MIRPRLPRVASGTRLTTNLVNGIINRTEYAADLLRQYKLVAGTEMYVEPHYDGTRVSYLQPVGGGATPRPVQSSFQYKVVGIYDDNQNKRRGFLYDGTTFKDIFVPDSFAPFTSEVFATGISGSRIVGYSTTSFGTPKPFIFDGINYSQISIPGINPRNAYGIDGENIVGDYLQGGQTRGFLYDGSNFTDIFVPGSQYTTANAIDGNTIAGLAIIGNDYRGFIFDGSYYQTFGTYPGSAFIFVRGISGSNILGIAGFPSPQPPVYFIYDGSSFTNIDIPRQGNPWNIKNQNFVGRLEDGSGEAFFYDGSILKTFSFPGSISTTAFDLD